MDEHSYIIPDLGNADDAYTYWTQNKLITHQTITINAVVNGRLH